MSRFVLPTLCDWNDRSEYACREQLRIWQLKNLTFKLPFQIEGVRFGKPPRNVKLYYNGKTITQFDTTEFFVGISATYDEELMGAAKDDLRHFGVHSELNREQIEELASNFANRLCRERELIKILINESSLWRDGVTTYRMDGGDEIGQLSKVVIIAPLAVINALATDYNKDSRMEADIIEGDKANALIGLPLSLFKGPTSAVTKFLSGHATFIKMKELRGDSRDQPFRIHEHLAWTRMGAMHPHCFQLGGEAPPQRSWGAVFGTSYVPFWANHDSDPCVEDLAVLVTLTKYPDGIYSYSIPGGKRNLGETALMCAEREVFEECEIRLNIASPSPSIASSPPAAPPTAPLFRPRSPVP